MPPLTPEQAVHLAASILLGFGLEEVARSADRKSFYLRSPGACRHLRVSNHRRTPRRRRQYPEVVLSLVFREPKSDLQVRTMAQTALKAYLTTIQRREALLPNETNGRTGRRIHE
jgi:hypothetical protein